MNRVFTRKIFIIFFVTTISIVCLFPFKIFATYGVDEPYPIGNTLAPTCAPGSSVNCTVASGGSGITSLDGLIGLTQTFSIGNSGTDFNIDSTGNIHTFNIPNASGANRGLLTSLDWSNFNNKANSGANTDIISLAPAGALVLNSGGTLGFNTTTNQPINTGTGLLTIGGGLTVNGTLSTNGNFKLSNSVDYPTTGTQNNVNLGTGSFFRYTGVFPATFTGITGGVDGRIITIFVKDGGQSLTLNNEDFSSAVGNQIITGIEGPMLIPENNTVMLQYEASESHWHVIAPPASATSLLEAESFLNGGSAFGATASLGTTDAFGLNFITGGATRFSLSPTSSAILGNGATSLNSNNTLSLASGTASNLNITSGTTGAITLDSGTTGAINIGTSADEKIVTIGNNTGATNVNVTSGTGGINLDGNVTISSGHTFTTGTGIMIQNSNALDLAGNDTVINMSGTGTLGLNTINNRPITTGNGLFTIGGDLSVSGNHLYMGNNTSGDILVADGTKFNPIVLSGDATINNTGALTLNYTGGQSADATHKGFLTATDWNTFNSKQGSLGYTPENVVNKSTSISLGTSDVLYPTQNAVKTYVDNKSLGLTWQNPVELVDLISDTAPVPVSPNNTDAYIINTGQNVGNWSTFSAGDLVQFQTDHWVLIKHLIAIGDRFGVAFKTSTVPSGSVSGEKNYVVQVTNATPGAFAYTAVAPINSNALFVQNVNAYYHNVSFTYSSSLAEWVQLSANASLSFGNGLSTVGNLISLGNLTTDWNQGGVFNINTAGDVSVNGGNLKTNASTATLFNNNATTLDIGGVATLINLGAVAGTNVLGGGALSIKSSTTSALTLDSGTTGTVNLGTGNNSKTINLGTGTAGDIINIGTNNTTLDNINIGSALDNLTIASSGLNVSSSGALTGVSSVDTISTSAAALTFAGSGTISSTGTNSINIDSGTTGAINIGTTADSKNITVGNNTGTSSLNLNSGSGGISFDGNTIINGSNTFTTGTGITKINSTAINLAGNNTVLDMSGTGTLSLNTINNIPITTGIGMFTVGNNSTINGALKVADSISTPKGTDYTTTGSQNDVNFGTGSYFRYIGINTATFTGIAGGVDGKIIRVSNASNFNIILKNENSSSLANNRILTPSGGDITIEPRSSFGIIYDAGSSRWRLITLPANPSSISGFAFINGGNGFGSTASFGTTDAFGLNLITSGFTRFSFDSASSTLTGNGATSLNSNNTLSLASGTASNLNITSGTTGAITLDSGTTGTVNLGTGNNSKTINLGTGTAGDIINIGSALDSFVLNSSGLNVSSSGALTSVASISSNGLISTSGNISTTGSGTITSAGLLTASNGLTETTGAINLTGTSGALALSGLSASSINTGTNALTITSSNLNITATGINSTAIGTTTPSSGKFTTITSTGATDLANTGASNVTIATTGTGNVTVGNSTGTFALTSSGGLNVSTTGVLTGVASLDTISTSATALTFAGAGTINSTTTSGLTLDSSTTGAINIGNNGNAKTITIGNTTGATAVNINAGTGGINFAAGPTSSSSNIRIGNSATATPDLLVLDNGTADPTGTNGGIYYSTATNKFRCYENGAWKNCIDSSSGANPNNVKTSNVSGTPLVATSSTNTTVTSLTITTGADEVMISASLEFDITSGAGVDQVGYIYRDGSACGTGGTQLGNTYTINGKTNGTKDIMAMTLVEPSALTSATHTYRLCVTTGSGGTVTKANLTAMEVILGADTAELYGTNDSTITMGDVVSIDPNLLSGVEKSNGTYDSNLLGVVSTLPGLLVGGGEREGINSVPVALNGRVPVNVNMENGAIEPGDFLTSSSTPGVAMKAIDSGMVIGQALTSFNGNGIGQVVVFIKNIYSPGNFSTKEQQALLGDISSTDGLSTLVSDIQNEIARNPITIINDKILAGKKFLTDFVVARITAIRGYFDEIFTNTSHQKTLCVGNPGDETCITKTELDSLLRSQSINVQNISSGGNVSNNNTTIDTVSSSTTTTSNNIPSDVSNGTNTNSNTSNTSETNTNSGTNNNNTNDSTTTNVSDTASVSAPVVSSGGNVSNNNTSTDIVSSSTTTASNNIPSGVSDVANTNSNSTNTTSDVTTSTPITSSSGSDNSTVSTGGSANTPSSGSDITSSP